MSCSRGIVFFILFCQKMYFIMLYGDELFHFMNLKVALFCKSTIHEKRNIFISDTFKQEQTVHKLQIATFWDIYI